MNETLRTIKNRKSVRVFEDREITEEEKNIILEAAISAPSAGNQQLYTIIDVQSQDIKDRLVKTCDDQPFIAKAKLLLIFCADCKKWYDVFEETGCAPRKPGVGDLLLAVSDANIAAQTAVLAAQSLGIGSCYIGDVMENYEEQRELLKLPEYVFPAAMVVFGYPTEQQKNREKPKRPPIDKIVSKDGYPEMDFDYRRKLFENKISDKPYEVWMKEFCDRKYNSDFSREMTRSVKEYINQFW